MAMIDGFNQIKNDSDSLRFGEFSSGFHELAQAATQRVLQNKVHVVIVRDYAVNLQNVAVVAKVLLAFYLAFNLRTLVCVLGYGLACHYVVGLNLTSKADLEIGKPTNMANRLAYMEDRVVQVHFSQPMKTGFCRAFFYPKIF